MRYLAFQDWNIICNLFVFVRKSVTLSSLRIKQYCGRTWHWSTNTKTERKFYLMSSSPMIPGVEHVSHEWIVLPNLRSLMNTVKHHCHNSTTDVQIIFNGQSWYSVHHNAPHYCPYNALILLSFAWRLNRNVSYTTCAAILRNYHSAPLQ